jgi:response regulator RpfG family c-di-GMP phosphodiesterase
MQADLSAASVRTAVSTPAPVILCVDDEPNILSSLRRLFHPQHYSVLTAESGAAGLAILAAQPVDLVISDMRMPQMNGAQFLEKVRAQWPATVRMLLTGYADIDTIVDAINRGEIHRYITKPWSDQDMLLIVRHALERQQLERDNAHLQALTRQQNDELKSLNASLEDKVRQRTAELKKAHDGLLHFNRKLKSNFLVSIKMFSNLIETRGGNLAGHSLRVADLARKIAQRMGLSDHDTEEIFVAAMLHDIGKIGLTDELLSLPLTAMNGDQLGQYRKHPLRSAQLLMPLDELRPAAAIIRAYQERFDGKGTPDNLAGMRIPVGARILAIASDYDNLQTGVMMQRKLWPDEARAAILHGRGTRYDPAIVDVFLQALDGSTNGSIARRPSHLVGANDLPVGAILAHDLVSPDGALLLSAEHELDARLIAQIVEFNTALATPLRISIYEDATQ